jgi:hypothetical protein
MQLFARLHQSERTRDLVCFPEGVVGYPDGKFDEDLRRLLIVKLEELAQLKDGANYAALIEDSGHPLLVYPDLTTLVYPDNGWVRADEFCNSEAFTVEVKQLLQQRLHEAFSAFETAGVIHTDARGCNVYVRFTAPLPSASSSSSSSSAAAATTTAAAGTPALSLSLKFIDWDDCRFMDTPIPEYLRSHWRDPIVRQFHTASREFHHHFMTQFSAFPVHGLDVRRSGSKRTFEQIA